MVGEVEPQRHQPRRERNRFDLIVVGAGSAGFSAAITACELGAEVALVGSGTIGGTCTNYGCLPSKTLLRVTEVLHGAPQCRRSARLSERRQGWRW